MPASKTTIKAAVESYRSQLSIDPENAPSMRQVAEKFAISPQTLSNRINRGVEPHNTAHTHQQTLTPGEEDALVDYIQHNSRIGHPITPAHARDIVQRIRESRNVQDDSIVHPVGHNWLSGFRRRHPTVISAFSRRLDQVRHSAVTREQLRPWFDQVQELMDKHHYPPDRVFNMDETGFALGSSQSKRVMAIVDKSSSAGNRRGVSRRPVQIEPGRQEWCTSIECVSAAGNLLAPMVILKGEGRMQSYWLPEGHEAKDWQWCVSNTGWSNDNLAFEWLRKVFQVQTRPADPSHRRLLIVDGHGSHVKSRCIGFCIKNAIDLLILPAHTSHVTQPLNIAVFGPLKIAMSHEVDRYARDNQHRISKEEFTTALAKSRDVAMTRRNIIKGWRVSGLYPLNPEHFFSHLREPSPPPPTASRRLSRTPLGSITLETENIIRDNSALPLIAKDHMRTLANTVSSLKAENTLLRDRETQREAAAAREKRPRAGMTAKYQGTFLFSTQELHDDARSREDAIRSKKAGGKGREAPSGAPNPSIPVESLLI